MKDLIVTCAECNSKYTVGEVNNDDVRFYYESDNSSVQFGSETTQEKIDSAYLICECCQEDLEDEENW